VIEPVQVGQSERLQLVDAQDGLLELRDRHPAGLEVRPGRGGADASRAKWTGQLEPFRIIISICS
jgi:hypothetical protein